MQYRSFTKDCLSVSALGFGCMRFPLLKSGRPDQRESIRMIRYALDHGVNYVDTAAPYHDGVSETIVGKALQNGYRNRTLVATKFPTWEPTLKKELDPIFEAQMQKLQVDCIDVYMLHCLQKNFWKNVHKLNMIEWLVKKKKQGKVRYIGFSFHDDLPLFREIIGAYDWDFCQIQYNYVCENVQAGTEGLKYAASKGLSVVIMEPLYGGVLATPTGNMGKVWQKNKLNPVDVALRWLWDKPEVSLVLSGMSTMEQTVQNVEIASQSGVGTLTIKEHTVIEQAQKMYNESMPIKCTKCRYCLPCPFGVDIPLNFEVYNNAISLSENAQLSRNLYAMLMPEQRADHCKNCGTCESQCPQKLSIRKHLKEVDNHLRSN